MKAGADLVTIHVEATKDAVGVLEQIHAAGAAAGLAFNPPTPVSAIEHCLPHCDTVLVMSVNPGYGGQAFEPVALEKLRALRDRPGPLPLLEIDGGIHEATIAAASAAAETVFGGFGHLSRQGLPSRNWELAREGPRQCARGIRGDGRAAGNSPRLAITQRVRDT